MLVKGKILSVKVLLLTVPIVVMLLVLNTSTVFLDLKLNVKQLYLNTSYLPPAHETRVRAQSAMRRRGDYVRRMAVVYDPPERGERRVAPARRLTRPPDARPAGGPARTVRA